MRRKKTRVRSVPQRNLMGYAYACATGRAEDCPPSVAAVAASFTKKGKKKGMESLRRMAGTKHGNLPATRVTESRILKFKEFRMNEGGNQENDFYYLDFLYKIGDPDINEFVNSFATSNDPSDKEEYIWCIDERIKQLRRQGRRFDESDLEMMRDTMKQIVSETVKKKTSKPK
jgi:hypothetical protein